jgi:hypothetical protein
MTTVWRSGLLVWAFAVPLASLADTAQDFSGEWIAATKDQQAQGTQGGDSATPSGSHHGSHGMGSGGMGGGGMGAGGGMGGGHGGGGGGRHHSGGSSGDSSGATASATAVQGVPRIAAQALTIRQSDVVFDIAADGGKRMVYRFDNRNNYGAEYGGTVTLTWSAPEMVIETHPDAGGSVEEHYTLSGDGKKLSLRVHEHGAAADTTRDITRVFVRNGTQDSATSTTLP